MKLRPSLLPLAGIPGSPQNLAAKSEMWNIADVISQGPSNPNTDVTYFYVVFMQQPCSVKPSLLFMLMPYWTVLFLQFRCSSLLNLITHKEYCSSESIQTQHWRDYSAFNSKIIRCVGCCRAHIRSDHDEECLQWFPLLLLVALLLSMGFLNTFCTWL